MNTEQMPYDSSRAKIGAYIKTLESTSSKSYLCKLVHESSNTCSLASVRMKYSSDENFDRHPCIKLLEYDYDSLVMATRAECEAAGVEYIEPPISADELTELRKDRRLLEHLISSGKAVHTSSLGAFFCSKHSMSWDVYASPREAIYASMKGSE
jgi:hypothetical protein